MTSLPKTVMEMIEEMDILYPPLTSDQILKKLRNGEQQSLIERTAIREVIDKYKLRLKEQHGG